MNKSRILLILIALSFICLPQEIWADSGYKTGGAGFYSIVMSRFQQILNTFINDVATQLFQLMKVRQITNFIGVFGISLWVVKKVQEGDFITWKNLTSMICFLTFLYIMNRIIQNPMDFKQAFDSFIDYPSSIIMDLLAKGTAGISSVAGTTMQSGTDSIDKVVEGTYIAAKDIMSSAISSTKIGWTGSNLGIFFVVAAVSIVLFVVCMIFICIVILVIIVTYIQIVFLQSLFPIMLICLYLPQTRGMAFKWLSMIFALTMYKPLLMLVALFNISIMNALKNEILALTSNNSDAWSNILGDVAQNADIMSKVVTGILGVLISTYLVKQVPNIIQQIMGAGGGIGEGIAGMGQKAMMGVMGAAAGMMGGGAAGLAKTASQAGGGGVGGALNAAAAVATGGATHAAGKGLAGLAKAAGNEKAAAGGVARSINAGINKATSAASGAMHNNPALSKIASIGSGAIQGIGGLAKDVGTNALQGASKGAKTGLKGSNEITNQSFKNNDSSPK
ncbi:type IV secretion system protein [Helicobacter jaachi]|nr:type IV secretion system protein [Helicobacter jaachi]